MLFRSISSFAGGETEAGRPALLCPAAGSVHHSLPGGFVPVKSCPARGKGRAEGAQLTL